MGTTSDFLKLRSSNTPKIGEWNINYDKALELAKKSGKLIIACWSNGDKCGLCKATEKCMMDKTFMDWQKTTDVYWIFQYSGDPDEGKVVHDWCYKKTGITKYPGFRISSYDSAGKIVFDKCIDGNELRKNKTGAKGAQNMVDNLKSIFSSKPADITPTPTPTPTTDYKVRLNEKLTVKKVNSILDAIDKNNGYCPCQAKTEDSKCHCVDFKNNKKIGEPCICNIYVKQKK